MGPMQSRCWHVQHSHLSCCHSFTSSPPLPPLPPFTSHYPNSHLPLLSPPLPSPFSPALLSPPLPQVSLALLTLHEDALLQCDSMESISEYIKVVIPDTALEHLPYILSYSLKAPPNFCAKLKGFEAEYHVLHNLKLSSSPRKEPRCLEEAVEEVRKQNNALIEQVAACQGAVTRLEAQLQGQLEREARKDKLIET